MKTFGFPTVCLLSLKDGKDITFPAAERHAWRVAGSERACLPGCCTLVSEKVGKGALVIKRRSSLSYLRARPKHITCLIERKSLASSLTLSVYITPQPPELFKPHCSLFDAKHSSQQSIAGISSGNTSKKIGAVYPLAQFARPQRLICTCFDFYCLNCAFCNRREEISLQQCVNLFWLDGRRWK